VFTAQIPESTLKGAILICAAVVEKKIHVNELLVEQNYLMLNLTKH
jgi:hypothetical protein